MVVINGQRHQKFWLKIGNKLKDKRIEKFVVPGKHEREQMVKKFDSGVKISG